MSRLLRGSFALAALVALLIGIPVALVGVVGRPWPHPMPSLDLIWRSISAGDITDTTVIKALAVLVWIAWARLAISLVIEIFARLGGGEAPRVIGLGSAQQWAAALVAAVVLMIGAGPRGTFASSSASTPRPISAALLHIESIPGTGSTPLAVHNEPAHLDVAAAIGDPMDSVRGSHRPSGDPWQVHIVERHESFWSIAQDTLGDGSRWREIVDANSGREVSPGVVFDGTANRLLPGWQLVVPGAIAAPAPSISAAAASSHTVVVESGDTLSEIAERELGDAGAWPTLWDANRDHVISGRVFDDPNLILTGWELIVPDGVAPVDITPVAVTPAQLTPVDVDIPIVAGSTTFADVPAVLSADADVEMHPLEHVWAAPVDAPVTVPRETAPPSTAPPSTAPPSTSPPSTVAQAPVTTRVASPDDNSSAVDRTDDGSAAAVLGGLGAAVLVASGVIGAVDVRRRRQLRAAAIHARLSEPAAGVVAIEQALRRLGSDERIARLEVGLRAAATDVSTAAVGVAVLGAIVSGDGRLDLLLSAAAPAAPQPWQVITAHRWRLPADIGLADIADAARRSNQPCPAMVHLGSTPLDGSETGELFVDLEALGLLAINGPAGSSTAVLRAMVAGLAVSPMAEVAHLVTCGIDVPSLGHPSMQHADSLDAALDLAVAAIGATAVMTVGTLSTFALRARQHGGEAWEPAIVFAHGTLSSAAGPSDVDVVALAGSGGRGLAVVVDRAVSGARWSLVHESDRWMLQPLGIECLPVGLDGAELDQLQRLLDETDRPLLAPESDDSERAAPTVTPSVAPPHWSLMVRILGPVEVTSADNRSAEFERSKAPELVVWLSQHREHSTRTGARTALWETDVRDTTFANVVSDARRTLARLVVPDAGGEWIGRTLTEDLPLHAAVITDADLLADRMRAADGVPPAEAIEVLRPALALVRDMPFSGTNYLWPDGEGITSQLTLLVTSAASTLANHYLSGGDTAGVFWATGQGLKVLPGHEELIALRMRAFARQGDLAGVRHEWESYERVLNAETFSDGSFSPKLMSLRRQLLSPSLAET